MIMSGLQVTFQRIQKLRRIAIPEYMMKKLNWEIGDQVIIDIYNGKVMIDSVKRTVKPIKERL